MMLHRHFEESKKEAENLKGTLKAETKAEKAFLINENITKSEDIIMPETSENNSEIQADKTKNTEIVIEETPRRGRPKKFDLE